MKSEKNVQLFRYILIALIVLSLVFIFGQSCIPTDKSAEESEGVGSFLEEIFSPDTVFGRFVLTNIRKIAHFTEFFILGVWVSLYAVLYIKKRSAYAYSLPLALFVAFTDETIQIFSGRGPMIFDVWIDFFGFASAAVIIYTVSELARHIRAKKQTKVNIIK